MLIYDSSIGAKSGGFVGYNCSRRGTLTQYTIATFKGTRIVSGHTVETQAEGVMQMLIGHRFGRLNAGWRDLFGLDDATVRLGLDYGITDDLNIGIGRSSYTKIYDGHIKYGFCANDMEPSPSRSQLRPWPVR